MCLDGDMWIVACLLDLILEVAAIMGSGVETIRCLNGCNDGWLLLRYGLKAKAQLMLSLRQRQNISYPRDLSNMSGPQEGVYCRTKMLGYMKNGP